MFKPMLAGKVTDFDKLKFPLLASPKLDGIRATVQGGMLVSRSLKPIPNKAIQAAFKGLPEGLDGELILGDSTAPDVFRKTTSKVMSPDEDAKGIMFHIFDFFEPLDFAQRITRVQGFVRAMKKLFKIEVVIHTLINNLEDLQYFEQESLAEGYEGLMVRSTTGPYKQGRSSEREGYLLKVKRFVDSEAEITGFEELMHNDNEAKTNELGRIERSSCKENMQPAGTLGMLIVRDLVTGVSFGIGTGFDAATRDYLWKHRTTLHGMLVKYKFFANGVKDKPRFPVFIGFRDEKDL